MRYPEPTVEGIKDLNSKIDEEIARLESLMLSVDDESIVYRYFGESIHCLKTAKLNLASVLKQIQGNNNAKRLSMEKVSFEM